MPKFRKKPVVIEARQFDGQSANADSIIEWIGGEADSYWKATPLDGKHMSIIRIPTLEGVMEAIPGDWIIRGVSGEFYPCKPDIFLATYEAVEDPK